MTIVAQNIYYNSKSKSVRYYALNYLSSFLLQVQGSMSRVAWREHGENFCTFVDSKSNLEMKSSDINMSLVDSYFTLLKSLSPNNILSIKKVNTNICVQ